MVRKVVSWLLKRDPSERVTADMATIMLAVVLWAPAEWLQSNSQVSVTDVNRWAHAYWKEIHLVFSINTLVQRPFKVEKPVVPYGLYRHMMNLGFLQSLLMIWWCNFTLGDLRHNFFQSQVKPKEKVTRSQWVFPRLASRAAFSCFASWLVKKRFFVFVLIVFSCKVLNWDISCFATSWNVFTLFYTSQTAWNFCTFTEDTNAQ